ncbi:hypothetical protein LTR64_000396 [Lithohypha guttulata]|uniref:uncharacterized protein n=1 Tax=Lithohypha guttulata TaxID=1690604 RepID=UPI00315D6CC4
MAIDEYQRRYSIAPPPHFDRWYEFATQRGMEPQLIRRRAREILGHDNSLMGASTRKGQVRIIGDGQDEFQAVATREMLSKFSEWLPDMDLAFNVNDEPRVLVPHKDVGRLLSAAALSKNSVRATKNAFSEPHDLEDETSFESASDSPFNRLDHQQTFTHARMSCPPSSPARSLGLNPEEAELGLKVGGLTFVENIATFSDICLSPSVRKVIGLFNKPNVFSVSHDLLPVFSPSKLSTFHDTLYPSPYYYAGKTKYDMSDSVQWNKKAPKLYWRGATSSGYSEGGTWRSLLRQSILAKLRPDGETRILVHENTDFDGSVPRWKAQLTSRETVARRYDTKIHGNKAVCT